MRWTPLLLLLLACDARIHGPGPNDDPPAVGLGISGLEPASGPAAGGTSVRVRGAGFSVGSEARVGGRACVSLSFLSDEELVCVTPAGAAGEVSLVVTDAGRDAAATWTYLGDPLDTGATDTDPPDTGATDTAAPDTDTDPPDTGVTDPDDTAAPDTGATDTTVPIEPVDYCHLQYPCAQSLAPGATSEAVYGWVYEAGVTVGAGVGAGTRLELGVGPAGSDPAAGGWSWSVMRYNIDKDGLVAGDLANDEWRGSFVAPAAAGTYAYAVRASADLGASWTFCDGGGDTCPGSGSDDGYDPDDAGVLTVR